MAHRQWRTALCATHGAAVFGAAYGAETLEQAVRESDFIVDLRARYESVEQGGFANDAEALTNRLRIGFQTAPLRKTALLAEAVWIGDLVDDYNSTTNGQTQYPVVTDPTGFAAVNRFAIINKSLEKVTLTFGRQRIVLDDQRFVGNVGWRQDEQTFDGVRAQLNGTAVKADVSYANQVNRVFGPDSPQGEWEGDIVLANVAHSFKSVGTLTMFDYYLDIDGTPTASSNTVGGRLAGAKPLGKLAANYLLSYAHQIDAGANPTNLDADYVLAEGGLTIKKVGIGLGYELLAGDGTAAFSTPLATLHAFQGWADKFLATPAAGIADEYVKFSYTFGKRGVFTSVAAQASFHDFTADVGSAHFGDEVDLQLLARTERMALTLKYADYRADTLFTDTYKVWVSVDYAF